MVIDLASRRAQLRPRQPIRILSSPRRSIEVEFVLSRRMVEDEIWWYAQWSQTHHAAPGLGAAGYTRFHTEHAAVTWITCPDTLRVLFPSVIVSSTKLHAYTAWLHHGPPNSH